MGLELVTGYWGMDHVTSEQDADRQAGIIGTGCYVLPIGEQMRAEAVTSNMVRIFDGTGMAYGRQFHIGEGEYENVTIENGTAGLLRNDFIILKYKKDEASGVEGMTFEVLKGASAETAVDPTPNNADIRTGVFESEIPLYRVRLNGLAIEAVEALYYVPSTKEALSKKCVELENTVAALNSKTSDVIIAMGQVGFTLRSGTINNSYLRKDKNTGLVEMHCEVTGIDTAYTGLGNEFAVVPSGYCPDKAIKFFGIGYNGTEYEPVLLSVETNGYVRQMYSSTKTYTNIYFDMQWYTDLTKFKADV